MRAPRRIRRPQLHGRWPLRTPVLHLLATAAITVAFAPTHVRAASGVAAAASGRVEVRAGLFLVQRGALERDHERMMEAAGLGEDRDFRPFSFQPYPASVTGDAGSAGISLSYHFTRRLAVSVAWDHEDLVRTLGRRAGPSMYLWDTSNDYFLEVTTRLKTISARASWGGPLRVEAGPALHFVEQRSLPRSGVEESERERRFGFLLGAGVSVPPDSWVFLDLAVQYRVVGRARRGPVRVASSTDTLTVPERSLSLDHGVITMGLGVRW